MRIDDWGLVDYEASVLKQQENLEEVAAGGEERIVFCTHPPVVTLGRATAPEDMIGWSGSTVEASRGGRATYHGPNQIVVYPLIDLRIEHKSFPVRDIHLYLRAMEAAIVDGLHEMGLKSAEARTTEVGGISLTGVWVGDHKIASIGIAVRKWITYHGAAINVLDDASAFRGIRPCGFDVGVMTSIEKELGRVVQYDWAAEIFKRTFRTRLA